MGGKALKQIGIETQRKTTEDLIRIYQEISQRLHKIGLTTHLVDFYRSKETHGDLDILIKMQGQPVNLKNWVRDNITTNLVYSKPVVSFEYENFQVDLIPIAQSNWETAKFFFDKDPSANLMGKITHKFGLKYGWAGLVYPFRNFSGRLTRDIVISKDPRKICEFLGFDYDRYINGFDTLEEIFEFVVGSKYFNTDYFRMENLGHIDRKRNKKRQTYQQFLEYVNTIKKPGYVFDKKDSYIDYIDKEFPEAKLKQKLKILYKKDEQAKEIASKFNGRLVMQRIPELKGKELGEALNSFKSMFLNFEEYVLNNKSEDILVQFVKWQKSRT